EAKVAGLAKTIEEIAPLPKQVTALDERAGTVDKSLAALSEEVKALKEEVQKNAKTAAATPAAAPAEEKGPESKGADESLAQGAELFKGGKYKEASALFRKLTETFPDDARVWYYAALSEGLASNMWQGEALRFVTKGVEREKAGTPEVAKINAVFDTL